MEIRKYGITLRRLTEKDIELVRRKRNSSFIKKHMLYREHITHDMQKKWFKKIDNANNIFFVIIHGRKKIGLTSSANIDWKKRSGEGGIFIWDQDYMNTPIPLIASLVSFQFFFNICGLKYCYIKVLKDNERAITFNEMFGFKRLKEDRNKNYYDFRVSESDYKKKTSKLFDFILKMSGDVSPLSVNDIDFSASASKSDKEILKLMPLRTRKAFSQ